MTHLARRAAALLCLASTAAWANNCDSIAAGIDARMRAGGLQAFVLQVVDAAASSAGRVVGTCDRGSRKIVQVAAAASGAASGAVVPPARRDDGIVTECRDGRVITGTDCRRR